jgi:hypothetical protein
MKMRTFALTVIAMLAAPIMAAHGQQYTYPHMSHAMHLYYDQHPDQWQQLLESLPRASFELPPAKPAAPSVGTITGAPASAPSGVGTWTSITHAAPVPLGNPIMLTDGTIMAINETSCSGNWYRFTPDLTSGFNAYLNGTWAKMSQQPPSNYAPRFFSSAVLPDGRVIIEGGEYNGAGCPKSSDTSLGAIYDPVANSWTAVTPPSAWSSGFIGDASGIVLANGTYLQTACCFFPPSAALLNPATLAWTLTGTGKFDGYDEESLALLQDDRVLTVDAYQYVTPNCGLNSEQYKNGTWTTAGNTASQQADCSSTKHSAEIGPLIMNPYGVAFSFPGLTAATSSNVNVFDPTNTTWSIASVLPSVSSVPYTMADAPGVVLPNGNILVAMSPNNWSSGSFPKPMHFWEYSPFQDAFTQVSDTAQAANYNSYQENFLELPNGTIMAFAIDAIDIEIYTPSSDNVFPSQFQPTVTSLPSCVSPGGSYIASGTQFNGLTEGAYYGDDTQASTNFPLVLMLNANSGAQYFAQTFAHSSRSIAPNAATSTSFRVPAMLTGPAAFYVIANGIPSGGTAVDVKSTCSKTASHDFNGDGKSDILWRNTGTGNIAIWLMNGGAVTQSTGFGIPSSFSVIGQHDFNGDGNADLLWRDTSGNLSMWFMNGVAGPTSALVGNLPSNWVLYGADDLNGDGKGDLLWRDSNTGTVAVWFMNGATVASSKSFGAVSNTWTILGDGYGSILWRDTAGDIALWAVQNGQVTGSHGLGTVTSNFVVQGIGDFNGDGNADILWRDTNSGTLSIWYTNGSQVTLSANVGTLPSNWNVVQVGDYNGDAKSDILFLDSAGDAAVWLMNGSTVSSSLGITNVGTTWQVQNLNAN